LSVSYEEAGDIRVNGDKVPQSRSARGVETRPQVLKSNYHATEKVIHNGDKSGHSSLSLTHAVMSFFRIKLNLAPWPEGSWM